MDQVSSGRGRGRGRGLMVKKALADAQANDRPGQETCTLRDENVSDLQIKAWIIKTLATKNGFLARAVPDQFESELKTKAPDDLRARIKSWTDIIRVESGPAGDIFYLNKTIIQPASEEKFENQHDTPKEEKCEDKDEAVCRGSIGHWQTPGEGCTFDVHVLYANTPSDFCICPYQLQPKLTKLMIELNKHFKQNTQNSAPVQSVGPGSVCTTNWDGTWYRVLVKSLPDADNKVQVCLADYAVHVQLEAEKLMKLPDKYTLLPFCGIKAQLHGVLPYDLDKGWTEESVGVFKKIVDRRDFVCVVCEGGGDGPVGVRLVDTSEEGDIVVDEILEELGLISWAEFE